MVIEFIDASYEFGIYLVEGPPHSGLRGARAEKSTLTFRGG
jgi:hypothetical protein